MRKYGNIFEFILNIEKFVFELKNKNYGTLLFNYDITSFGPPIFD
jgi:hypothetical protein